MCTDEALLVCADHDLAVLLIFGIKKRRIDCCSHWKNIGIQFSLVVFYMPKYVCINKRMFAACLSFEVRKQALACRFLISFFLFSFSFRKPMGKVTVSQFTDMSTRAESARSCVIQFSS